MSEEASTERELREAPICAAGVAKLREEGYTVACEIPIGCGGSRNADAAGKRNGLVLILEAKVSFTKGLKRQLNAAEMSANYIVGIVSTRPRQLTLDWAHARGYGVWWWDGKTVYELVEPFLKEPSWAHYRDKVIQRIDVFNDATPGGRPNLKGVGPTQDCQRAVDEYRAKFPKATWREIWANVPNHYDSAKNMYSALRSNLERLAFRARQKAARQLTEQP